MGELTVEDTSDAAADSFDSEGEDEGEDEDEELAMAIRMSLQEGSVSVGELSQRQEAQQQHTADLHLDSAMDLDSAEEEAEERDVAGHNEMIEREMALRRQRRP